MQDEGAHGGAPLTTSVGRRAVLGGSVALGIASLALPSAGAAASVSFTSIGSYGCTENPWAAVPFLAAGQSAIVESTTVAATVNSGVQGDGAFVYLHQSNDRIRTTLRFTPGITTLRLRTRNHADGTAERYDFTFLRSGSTVLTAALQHVDTTEVYTVAAPGFDTLDVFYTHPTPAGFGTYGSYLELWVPCS